MTVAGTAPDDRTRKGRPVVENSSWPQQPVISIRISDALRTRLERLKELLSKKSGDNVTTSEVAKQLLESAREDRLEVAELLTNATVALAAARRKGEAGISLSRAEWIVLAYYVQQGIESDLSDPVSRETMKGVIEAFLAAYQVRRGKKSNRDAHYISNLPRLNKDGKRVGGSEAEEIDVPTAIERLIRAMKVCEFERSLAAIRGAKSIRVSGGGILRHRGDESGSEAILADTLASSGPGALSDARLSRSGTRPVAPLPSIRGARQFRPYSRADLFCLSRREASAICPCW
jgi:hypothetical protein